MNWFKFFRLVNSPKKQPLTKPSLRMGLEKLEERDVPAVPSVVSVTPGTGGLLNPTSGSIVVTYSEDVTGADDATNYQLFGSNGKSISIGSVQYAVNLAGQGVATIQATSLNGG